MIKSIEIAGLRGVLQGSLLGFAPLTVLVGPNGSGKSTVLDAILIAAGREPENAIGRAARRRQGLPGGQARWMFWKAGLEGGRCTIRIEAASGSARQCDLELVPPAAIRCVISGSDGRRGEVIVGFQEPHGYVSHWSEGRPMPADQGFDSAALVEPGVFSAAPSSVDHVHRPRPLHDLFTQARVLGRGDEVDALVRRVAPEIRRLEILSEGPVPLLHAHYGSKSVPVALLGDGIQALIRVTLELAACGSGTLLIEEPEVHQHPRALRQAAKVIAATAMRRQTNQETQVVLSTHSLDLIDALAEELPEADLSRFCLFRLALRDGVLRSSRLTGHEVRLKRISIEEDLR